MRVAIFLCILTACYDKSGAVEQLEDMGRPRPITCVFMNSGHSGDHKSFACSDAVGKHWICDTDGCIQWAQ
jgi:hypothetical protein